MATEIKKDETLVLFPVIANYNSTSNSWDAVIHGHVFEKEEDSFLRNKFVNSLKSAIDLPEDSYSSSLFKERIWWFLVDNERWKKIKIQVLGTDFSMDRTSANGHFKTQISIPAAKVTESVLKAGYATTKAIMPDGDKRTFEGKIFFLKDEGYSLVTDIDDTIKISDVRNKKQLIKNTFLEPFKAVPGMPELYQNVNSKNGVFIHYISASPWQMFTLLSDFLKSAGFPNGSYTLKDFRVKDTDFFNLFTAPEKYKVSSIEPIIQKFPKRKFILVGDSGEKDPEAYGELARKYPNNVEKIWIRKAYQEDLTERFKKAFQNVEPSKIIVFEDPKECK